MLHLFDTNSKGTTLFNKRLKRVELPQDIIFFGGFNDASCIYHNYSQGKKQNLEYLMPKNKGRD